MEKTFYKQPKTCAGRGICSKTFMLGATPCWRISVAL